MNYYQSRQRLIKDIEGIITKNAGKEIDLQQLFYLFAKKYGFSERIIMKFLKYHEDTGSVIIRKDKLEILGGKDGKANKKKQE